MIVNLSPQPALSPSGGGPPLGRWAFFLALALVIAAPATARAQSVPEGPLSMFGGKLLRGHEQAIAAGFGWPGMFFEYDIGVSNPFNLGFRGDLYFGNPFGGFDVGLGFGFSVIIAFVYWGFMQLGKALGHSGLISPYVAAWMGDVVFGTAAVLLLAQAQRS